MYKLEFLPIAKRDIDDILEFSYVLYHQLGKENSNYC